MKLRQDHPIEVAAAKAGMSRATGYRISQNPKLPSQKPQTRGRRRPDPLEHIFDAEVVPLLQSAPGLHAGQDAGLQQAIAKGQMSADQINVEWDASGDRFTRPSHSEMDRQRRGYGQPFVSPTGAMMRYPGDTGLGAPASEVINCRCHLRIRLNLVNGLKSRLTPEELATVRTAL
tara:strand:+ start:106 stop:630 length:525 start_codon:yes stop_codon:yes gene_type:complete